MSIIIGADVVPCESNLDLFINGNTEALAGKELLDILQKADYRVCNLEVPRTDQEEPISKFGPNLIAPTSSVNGLKALGIGMVTLANNHILDHGPSGLESTIRALEEAGISYAGAGKNVIEARKPIYYTMGEKRIGFYACAEHEFSIATEHLPGANPYDALNTFDDIRETKDECDYLVVLYHGGKEHYRYPSPGLQRICRKMVEKGADLVVCQHSHCIGCKEDYLQGTIVYGQGNFIFSGQDNEFWNTGLLISLDDQGEISYVPLTRTDKGIRLAPGDEGKEILEAFYRRSADIQEEGFVDEKYKQFAEESIDSYIRYFSETHNGLLYRAINRLSCNRIRKWTIQHYLRNKKAGMMNYIECEAHRELLLKGLKSR